jgi:XTP/dITP diphosphohydrolase
MYIFIASQNEGKIAEARKIFSNARYHLVSLNDQQLLKKLEVKIPAGLIVEESGTTLKENALIKARAFYQLTQLPCIADDSGLFLEAYPGFPGVNSNRWAVSSDQGRNLALLKKLKNQDNRRAKFQTILCLFAFNQKEPLFFSGEIRGQIAHQPKGEKGFGYDPIFIPVAYQKSFAELGLKVKNKISHRAKAWQALAEYLEKTKQS